MMVDKSRTESRESTVCNLNYWRVPREGLCMFSPNQSCLSLVHVDLLLSWKARHSWCIRLSLERKELKKKESAKGVAEWGKTACDGQPMKIIFFPHRSSEMYSAPLQYCNVKGQEDWPLYCPVFLPLQKMLEFLFFTQFFIWKFWIHICNQGLQISWSVWWNLKFKRHKIGGNFYNYPLEGTIQGSVLPGQRRSTNCQPRPIPNM